MRRTPATMLIAMAMFIGTGATSLSAQATRDITGSWLGSLDVGGTTQRLVFNVERDSTGALTTKLDSPDQGVNGIPVSGTQVAGDSVKFIVAAVAGDFMGAFSADGTRIIGRWQQGGGVQPLVLRRGKVEAPSRPQNPGLPFPYDATEVTFPNQADRITLAGTLTLPRSAGPHPAVILISGSGPQDRDESIMEHKPFLVLADHLTRNGIAVLRYDDRGVGKSTGMFATATSENFMSDALAATAYLRTRTGIDPARIGLAGHSEGGLIAPMAAAQSRDIAFIILLAGPGVTGEEILYAQGEKIMRASGVPDPLIERNRDVQRTLFTIVREEPDREKAAEQMRTQLREVVAAMSPLERQALGVGGDDPGAAIEVQIRQVNSPWFRFFLSFDPATALSRVTVPVLALNGELDLQVPHDQNLPAIEAALRSAGNPDVTARTLPRLNHLFQTATTGVPAEYARIQETFSPAALDLITSWINTRFGTRR
ncbi:MAG: alpha/beta fold hydrolase [Gemmatimonadetes bacterium]|nr:alpha/beta fold hydrolase [Gemmatimonadota bacterium]